MLGVVSPMRVLPDHHIVSLGRTAASKSVFVSTSPPAPLNIPLHAPIGIPVGPSTPTVEKNIYTEGKEEMESPE